METDLVQLITELVMAELSKADSEPSAASLPVAGKAGSETPPSVDPVLPGPRRQVLVCPVVGHSASLDPFWLQLREASEVSWLVVRVPGVCLHSCEQKLLGRCKLIDVPANWNELLGRVEAVVLPTLTTDLMARLSLLLSDVPAAGAALAGIVQGKPVLASASEANEIRRASGRLPGGFLNVFHQYLRQVESLGVQILEPPALIERLAGARAAFAGSSARGRDVVTVEDLEAAVRAGQKQMQLAPGTIVTPLARDKAREMGIEMSFA